MAVIRATKRDDGVDLPRGEPHDGLLRIDVQAVVVGAQFDAPLCRLVHDDSPEAKCGGPV